MDALRQATCTAEEQAAAHSGSALPNSYDALETPVMKKNKSFANLVQDLSNHVSPDTSNRGEERERVSREGKGKGEGEGEGEGGSTLIFERHFVISSGRTRVVVLCVSRRSMMMMKREGKGEGRWWGGD